MSTKTLNPHDRRPLSALEGIFIALLALATSQSPAASYPDSKVDAYYLLIDVSISMNDIPKVPAVPANWTSSKLSEVKRQLANLCQMLPTEASVRVFTFAGG